MSGKEKRLGKKEKRVLKKTHVTRKRVCRKRGNTVGRGRKGKQMYRERRKRWNKGRHKRSRRRNIIWRMKS